MPGAVNDEEMAPAPIGLALRVEDKWWVAYVVTDADLEQAVEVGRIALDAARLPTVNELFKTAMIELVRVQLVALGASSVHISQSAAPKGEGGPG
jgi:hypothetical protein